MSLPLKFDLYFIGGAKLKDLVDELQGVTDWFHLGLCLRVPESVLMTIQRDIWTTSECRKEMLIAWMKREVPTWSTLVKALLDMGMPDLAMEIASKYLGKLRIYVHMGRCLCQNGGKEFAHKIVHYLLNCDNDLLNRDNDILNHDNNLLYRDNDLVHVSKSMVGTIY